MPSYVINLSPAQDKALGAIAFSQQQWIENVVYQRCEAAIAEIVAAEVERITASGGTLSGTKEDIVLASSVQSAAERQAQHDAELTAQTVQQGA